MQYTSLDGIVKSVLMQKGYTIHFYIQYLKLAGDCLRELHFDTLRVIQTVKLPVDRTNGVNIVTMPCDYVDWVKVGIPYGQEVRPLVQNQGINRLNNYDSAGEKTSYGVAACWATGAYNTIINDYGEHMGRQYGHRQSGMTDGLKELRERGEFQLSELVETDWIILEYISNGTGLSDAATSVDPYAQRTIETYIEWKTSRNRNNPISQEAEAFYAQLRILRARKNPLRPGDIIRMLNRGTHSSLK